MAPKGRSRIRLSPRISATASSLAIKSRKTRFRRRRPSKPKNREVSASSPRLTLHSPSCPSSSDSNLEAKPPPAATGGGFSTPKAQRFRLPTIKTCPPAPKKQRLASNNDRLQRRHIPFFSHPDIEHFFNLAFRSVSL